MAASFAAVLGMGLKMGAYATFEMKVTYNIVAHSLFDRFPQFAAFILTMYKYAFKTYYNAILCFTSFPKKTTRIHFSNHKLVGEIAMAVSSMSPSFYFFPCRSSGLTAARRVHRNKLSPV